MPSLAHTFYHLQDIDNNGYIDYVEWLESMQPNDAQLHPFFVSGNGQQSLLPRLDDEEIAQMNSMVDRLEKIAEAAARKSVHTIHYPLLL